MENEETQIALCRVLVAYIGSEAIEMLHERRRGLSLRDISIKYGTTRQAVCNRLRLAKRKLKAVELWPLPSVAAHEHAI